MMLRFSSLANLFAVLWFVASSVSTAQADEPKHWLDELPSREGAYFWTDDFSECYTTLRSELVKNPQASLMIRELYREAAIRWGYREPTRRLPDQKEQAQLVAELLSLDQKLRSDLQPTQVALIYEQEKAAWTLLCKTDADREQVHQFVNQFESILELLDDRANPKLPKPNETPRENNEAQSETDEAEGDIEKEQPKWESLKLGELNFTARTGLLGEWIQTEGWLGCSSHRDALFDLQAHLTGLREAKAKLENDRSLKLIFSKLEKPQGPNARFYFSEEAVYTFFADFGETQYDDIRIFPGLARIFEAANKRPFGELGGTISLDHSTENVERSLISKLQLNTFVITPRPRHPVFSALASDAEFNLEVPLIEEERAFYSQFKIDGEQARIKVTEELERLKETDEFTSWSSNLWREAETHTPMKYLQLIGKADQIVVTGTPYQLGGVLPKRALVHLAGEETSHDLVQEFVESNSERIMLAKKYATFMDWELKSQNANTSIWRVKSSAIDSIEEFYRDRIDQIHMQTEEQLDSGAYSQVDEAIKDKYRAFRDYQNDRSIQDMLAWFQVQWIVKNRWTHLTPLAMETVEKLHKAFPAANNPYVKAAMSTITSMQEAEPKLGDSVGFFLVWPHNYYQFPSDGQQMMIDLRNQGPEFVNIALIANGGEHTKQPNVLEVRIENEPPFRFPELIKSEIGECVLFSIFDSESGFTIKSQVVEPVAQE